MPRTTFAALFLLFIGFALAMPGKAVAGPPEGASGKMGLLRDEVADGLRKYRRTKNDEKCFEWLLQVGPTRDPRIGVVLGELMVREPRFSELGLDAAAA